MDSRGFTDASSRKMLGDHLDTNINGPSYCHGLCIPCVFLFLFLLLIGFLTLSFLYLLFYLTALIIISFCYSVTELNFNSYLFKAAFEYGFSILVSAPNCLSIYVISNCNSKEQASDQFRLSSLK